MENTQTNWCQCCAMPMTEESQFGTNADGTKNSDYCEYCYKDGEVTFKGTMEEFVEHCIPFVLKEGVYPNAEVARAEMLSYFPQLKHWKK